MSARRHSCRALLYWRFRLSVFSGNRLKVGHYTDTSRTRGLTVFPFSSFYFLFSLFRARQAELLDWARMCRWLLLAGRRVPYAQAWDRRAEAFATRNHRFDRATRSADARASSR